MKRIFVALFVAACSFPPPAEHSVDAGSGEAGTDGNDDAAAGCDACQLLAIEPSNANTGDTIALEGTFADGTIVHFPGGSTAPATLLGAHRATVVVPATVTAGELTVTTGTTTIGVLPFRRSSFALGLQPFQQFDEQTNRARAMPALMQPRTFANAVVAHGFVYVIGGANDSTALTSIEAAQVSADGSLGSFAVSTSALTTARASAATVVVGDTVYVLGGCGETCVSIESAAIQPDGTLGAFAVVSNASLVKPRHGHTATIIGNWVYVIGGYAGGFDATVERAPINPDGSLGTFALAESKLATARAFHATVLAGAFLYVLGGQNTGGQFSAIASVERAAIDGDGALGTFEAGPPLSTPRQGPVALVLGNELTVIGGADTGSDAETIETAPIAADGTVGTFATVAGATLAIPVNEPASVQVCDSLYLLGGQTDDGSYTAALQVAAVNASGAIGAPVAVSTALAAPRDRFHVVVSGSNLYAIGGVTNNVASSSVERAAIAPDGTIGPLAPVSGTSLITPRDEPGVALIGGFVYVIGGAQTGSGPFIGSVERAAINSDGSLGAFATVSGVALVTARNSFATVVLGNELYVIGGYNGGSPLASIERAPINTDGTLGSFTTATSTLANGRNAFGVFVADNFVYAIGGFNGSALSSVERAAIGTDGVLGSFVPVSGSVLATARYGFLVIRAGSAVYVLGGYGDAALASVEQATLASDGTLGAWTTSAAMLATARAYPAAAGLGNFAYVLGGQNPSSLASSEQSVLE